MKGRRFILNLSALLLVVLPAASALGQKVNLDSLKIDTTAVVDTTSGADSTAAETAPPIVEYLRPVPHLDSLLKILPLQTAAWWDNFDFPQMSSRFDYDPAISRVAQGPWGEGEQLYPLGLPPTSLSRADPLFGDNAISNPVPVPISEEALRIDPSQKYYLLSPGLAGAIVPFSRETALYQPLPKPPGDSARSKIYVRRGRYGYANTQVDFASQFGNLGSAILDGNFIKLDNQVQFLQTEDQRLRLIVEPNVGTNSTLQTGIFFNRDHSDRQFFPGFYLYRGRITDNYSGATASFETRLADLQSAGVTLRYRDDEQIFESSQINHRQRSRIYEGSANYQVSAGRNDLRLQLDSKVVNYKSGSTSESPLYWQASGSDMLALRPEVVLFVQAGLAGASGLNLQPLALGILHYQFSGRTHAALLLSHLAAMPQPEERYMPELLAGIAFGDSDYSVQGNPDLESGSSNSIELMGATSTGKLDLNLRLGATQLNNAPLWSNDRLAHTLGGYQPVGLDRNLIFATLNAHLRLPYGTFVSTAYGFRNLSSSGYDLTYGAAHEVDGFSGIRFWWPHFQVTITAALGGKFRSRVDRYLDGSTDKEKFVAESFLSVDLKRFHFFWNYTNLFDSQYYLNGLLQPGRSHWWGFSWEFFD